VNIQSEGAIEDFPIAKGGRFGRQQMEDIMQAFAKGDIGAVRKIVQDFDTISQPRSAYFFYSCSHKCLNLTLVHRGSRSPTSILSAERRRIIFRSFRSKQVTEEFMTEFTAKVSQFSHAVQLQHCSHTRGEYGYFNFGFQHAYGNNDGVGSFPVQTSKKSHFMLRNLHELSNMLITQKLLRSY
jgi:hypothetical protein